MTLIGQGLRQFPESLREVALNSARTKIAFGTSATDAKRLAEEFGPGVEPDFFPGLARYEAIGAVSLGGTVSPPFTFATEALGPAIPGRAAAIRKASRERFGIPKEEIEAAIRERPKRAGQTSRGRWAGGRNDSMDLSVRVSGRCTDYMPFTWSEAGPGRLSAATFTPTRWAR